MDRIKQILRKSPAQRTIAEHTIIQGFHRGLNPQTNPEGTVAPNLIDEYRYGVEMGFLARDED